ncbi:hypothetical protein RF55_20147 [Lasius niger]|uniref:Uncharacterized protein n=1 Tax=Lasius niger TaxID=67767 RepID=A0A0J7JZR4_LASNI|nr:hypothetical protein RF55_20147 [Lasius niger]
MSIVKPEETQTGPGQKFYLKFLGPYEVTSVLRNNYLVQKSEHNSDLENDTQESIEGDAPCRMAEYSVMDAEQAICGFLFQKQ